MNELMSGLVTLISPPFLLYVDGEGAHKQTLCADLRGVECRTIKCM